MKFLIHSKQNLLRSYSVSTSLPKENVLKVWIGPLWSARHFCGREANWRIILEWYVPRHAIVGHRKSLYGGTWINAVTTLHVEF